MNTAVALAPEKAGEIIEAVIARGDIAQLNPQERAKYYVKVCESVGLNPMTRPFEYITLNGKLTLYARKDCTDQLRTIHNVSVTDLIESEREGVFIITAKVVNGKGRADASKGAVFITGLKGEALANALMKAETKAKRRATLSICGLGFLDELEVEDIPAAAKDPNAVKTLPKKDSRDIYTRMQAELDKFDNLENLQKWGVDNADRIKVLPEDWQDILRLRFEEKRLALRQAAGQPGEKIDAETGEVTDTVEWVDEVEADEAAKRKGAKGPSAPGIPSLQEVEKTGGDPDAIPPGLRRAVKPKEPEFNEADWASDCGHAAAVANTIEELAAAQAKHYTPHEAKASAKIRKIALGTFTNRAEELSAEAEFDGAQWLRDLDGALGAATEAGALADVKNKTLLPAKEKVTPAQWNTGVKAYRARVAELVPQDLAV